MRPSPRVRLLGAAAILSLAATPAAAQKQILSAITSELADDETEVDQVSTAAGSLVTYQAGTNEGRVLTNYGVNKVFASSADNRDMTASSAWMDTFTAQGAAGTKVKMSLSFTVDGNADFGGETGDDAPEYGFKVYAMRGSGWTMAASNEETRNDGRYGAFSSGRGYDTLFLQRQRPNGNFEQLNMGNDTRTMLNFGNANGQPGAFLSEVTYDVDQDLYRTVNFNAQGGFYQGGYYYKDRFRGGGPDVPNPNGPVFAYAGPNPGPGLGQVRSALENGFSILDAASLCIEEVTCLERAWAPTTLNLEFDVLAGESFTLAAWMYADSVDFGATIDFFNTAKFTGLQATDEAGQSVAVTSASNTLVALPGGGFAPAAAVPEPESWAMMILGLGAIGGAMRRRRTVTVTYA